MDIVQACFDLLLVGWHWNGMTPGCLLLCLVDLDVGPSLLTKPTENENVVEVGVGGVCCADGKPDTRGAAFLGPTKMVNGSGTNTNC